jgi:hypothetical protein
MGVVANFPVPALGFSASAFVGICVCLGLTHAALARGRAALEK